MVSIGSFATRRSFQSKNMKLFLYKPLVQIITLTGVPFTLSPTSLKIETDNTRYGFMFEQVPWLIFE
jgi:hypothetical protein